MLKNKLSTSILIPAYNEEINIKRLIKNLLDLRRSNWSLDKIIVISDGSTDKTVGYVKSIKNNKILLIDHTERKGKPNRLNEGFKLANSDVVITFDADIKLGNNEVINNLISGFMNKEVVLISGSAYPKEPKSSVEKAMYQGVNIWNTARYSVKNSEMYFCEGQIRAFKKSLYKKIKFPNKSADDVYPFLYLDDKNKFKFIEEAVSYYKLPSTFKDLISQQRRYLRSVKLHTATFNKKLIRKYFVISFKDKVKATFLNLKTDFIWTCVYLVIMFFIKIDSLFFNSESSAKWEILTTTKVL